MENFFKAIDEQSLIYFLKKILQNLSFGAYITDETRKIIFWNRAAEKISGYKASEMLETHCYHNLLQHIDQKGNRLCLGACPLAKTIQDRRSRRAKFFFSIKMGIEFR